ncbi:MAG: hypothetical protein AMS16_06700 [Planctomycetes bacterium DG_58]|nr:MAG: hypothetical protein AMS16_06700 [Planctomycetes bacterium DG_58]KPL04521.1 MAG: hypothetical protein AMK75_01075 [Planctomycetes bacterium SM23_65]
MTDYLSHPGKSGRRARGPRRSGGGTVVQVLTFLGMTVIIVAAVIAYEKKARTSTSMRDEPPSSTSVGPLHSDDPYKSRGLQPNTPTTPPTKEPTTDVAPATPPSDPTPTVPEYRYIGRSDWNRYHRPNCKYAMNMPEDKKVFFTSAADAIAKGYIPCKICRPPVPSSDSLTPTVSRPKPTTSGRPAKPIRLPVKDVTVSFPFKVLDREVIADKGVIRIELTAEVEKPLNRDNILLLARKLVAAEIKKQAINAVSILMQKKTTTTDPIKWICWVDWAPYGNLVRASEVVAGDYHTHQFDIFQHGTIQLRR